MQWQFWVCSCSKSGHLVTTIVHFWENVLLNWQLSTQTYCSGWSCSIVSSVSVTTVTPWINALHKGPRLIRQVQRVLSTERRSVVVVEWLRPKASAVFTNTGRVTSSDLEKIIPSIQRQRGVICESERAVNEETLTTRKITSDYGETLHPSLETLFFYTEYLAVLVFLEFAFYQLSISKVQKRQNICNFRRSKWKEPKPSMSHQCLCGGGVILLRK